MPPSPRPVPSLIRPIAIGAGSGAVIGVALALPASAVERLYASGLYPRLQALLTSLSNLVPVAVFDLVIVAAAALLLRGWWRAIRRAVGDRRAAPIGRALLWTAASALAGYAWFLAAWGLNYQRPPVDVRLALPPGQPTDADVAALLARAVDGANRDAEAAHAEGFPTARAVPAAVVEALHRVERRHGRPRATVPARPKRTLLAPYFRVAGVDGLTAPAVLETLLNPDLTGPERPFVLAHEWAHLAGYAPEADANFIAYLATQEAGVAARYSSWIFLIGEAAAQLPGEVRRPVLAALTDVPRRDLQAIARRADSRVDLVAKLGWRAYDGYLRSQGVPAGVRDYSRVLELLVRADRKASREGD